MSKNKFGKKFGLQHQLRSENEYLRAQLRAYQLIVAECLAVVHGVPLERAADFIPPPVELRTDFSDEEIRRRVQEWWQGRERTYDRYEDVRSRIEPFAASIYDAVMTDGRFFVDAEYTYEPWSRLLPGYRRRYLAIAENYINGMPRET